MTRQGWHVQRGLISSSIANGLPPPESQFQTQPQPCPPRRDEARTQDRIALSDGAEEDQTHTKGQQEQDNITYDAHPETTNFPVPDGYVSFTCTFRYLGSLNNYSLHGNDDITARIASATAAMGALKEMWRTPHLDVHNKYLLFRAIPMNLLLWGAETWSLRLRKSQLDQLEVFLHHSIRRILQILMSAVKEEKFVRCFILSHACKI